MYGDVQNSSVYEYLEGKSAHDDVAEALTVAVARLTDVQIICPDPAQYLYVAVSTRGVVFGFSVGMNTIGFRLAPEMCELALKSGAVMCQEAGPNWVSFTLFRGDSPEPDLRFWAQKAYAYARTEAPG